MNIFKDNNDWNEKSIIGFIAFLIMCLIMIADLVTGWIGKDLIITGDSTVSGDPTYDSILSIYPNLPNGATFLTSDTNKLYMWNGTDTWNEVG